MQHNSMKPLGKINPDAQDEPHLMDAPESMELDSMEPGMVYQVPALVANVDGQLAVLGFAGSMYAQDAMMESEMEDEGEEDEYEDEEMGSAAASMGFLESVRKRLMK